MPLATVSVQLCDSAVVVVCGHLPLRKGIELKSGISGKILDPFWNLKEAEIVIS